VLRCVCVWVLVCVCVCVSVCVCVVCCVATGSECLPDGGLHWSVGREPEGSVRLFALACLRVSCRLLEVRAACGGGCTFRVLSAPAPSPGSAAVALQQLGLLAPRWRVVGQGSFPCRPPRTCTTSHISVSPSSCDQLVHRFDPVQYPICCICCWPMPTPQHIGALPVQNASLLRCGLVGVARRSERCVR